MEYSGQTGSLTITDTNLQDAGTYRCEADNKVKKIDCEANLTVLGKSMSYD